MTVQPTSGASHRAGGSRPFDPVNLSAKTFWDSTAAEREESFARLRAERPISWQPPVEDQWHNDPDDVGYWAVVRHADIAAVSKRSDVFVSGLGVQFENLPPKVLRSSQSILAMDAPEHTTTRKLISAAFTPKQVSRIIEQIDANAAEIVDGIAGLGTADFVNQAAALLPNRTVCDMIGVAVEDREGVARSAEIITGWNDPEVRHGRERGPALFEAGMHLSGLARTLAAARRQEPRKDLITSLVQAEVDGRRLSDHEISAFFTLLCIAGTDTTRQTAAHAIVALTRYSDQRAWLMEDFDARIGTAVEEFVRWASPVMTFKRTCTAEIELGGTVIRPGEKVVMFYPSGNWDTEVFEHPDRLDLSRSPNPHQGFGGGGAHFCLGNQVAKMQLRALLREVLHRLPDIRAGEPELLAGNFIHGVKRLPVIFTPESAVTSAGARA